MMKKILFNIISLLLIFALFSCGTIQTPHPDHPDEGDGPNPPADDGGNTEGYTFTVELEYNGAPFIPSDYENTATEVKWSDGYTFHTATVDETGRAEVQGLDGDYNVTLLNLPDGYTYNANQTLATNNNRAVKVQIYKIIDTGKKSGSDYYNNIIEITRPGVYRATVKKAGKAVYYQFAPTEPGTYLIESWVDANYNNVNPILHIHEGSAQWKNPTPIVVDGGSTGFTSNFKYQVYVDDDNISKNGSVVYAFGILADITDGEYPLYIDFCLSYVGEYDATSIPSDIMVPKELDKVTGYKPGHEYGDDYVFVGAEKNIGGQNIFEDDFYKLNPETGFYHLYDLEAYPETNGFGPILYAHISSPTSFTDAAFTTIEAAGNKVLTVSNGTENYKLFIEGYYPLTIDPLDTNPQATSGPYLCNRNCPCRTSGVCDGGCPLTCTRCLDDCRKVPAEAIGCVGYAGVANSDGLCPVTEELKDFLQKFAVAQRYFMDGNGWAETKSDPPFHAGEDDQWLFACGYYVKSST